MVKILENQEQHIFETRKGKQNRIEKDFGSDFVFLNIQVLSLQEPLSSNDAIFF